MKLKIKICGLRDPENIQEVVAMTPDYMGFIFYKNSPRYVQHDFILGQIPESIDKVGVFVDESPDGILEIVRKYNFDFVQLHGDESASDCGQLKSHGVKIIKVFSIHNLFDFEVTKDFESVADYFLFDTKGKFHGGNAQTFNWKILEKYSQRVPFFLSGGLSIDNIQRITTLNEMNLHALDLNSGVEISPGLKSVPKIRDIQRVLTLTLNS